jgi:crotonobetainyl-CoA:carnitine CoA-transferase CaiB-like acyl-CoA transferase
MGTWSHEPFGNDSANDWAYDLEECKDFSVVAAALQRVAESEDYLDADEAVEAIAAAEVLAKALGRGTQSDAYTEKVDAWLTTITTKPSAELLQLAQRALARVLAPESELRELWEESDHFAEWVSSVVALQSATAA